MRRNLLGSILLTSLLGGASAIVIFCIGEGWMRWGAVALLILTTFNVNWQYKNMRRILLPLKDLGKAVEELGRGNFEYQIKSLSNDEVGAICRKMNQSMQSVKSISKALIQITDMLKSGDFSKDIDEDGYTGQFKTVIHNINQMIVSLREEISRINAIVNVIENSSAQVADAAQVLATDAESQSIHMESISDKAKRIEEGSNSIEGRASGMAEECEATLEQLQLVNDDMNEAEKQMQSIVYLVAEALKMLKEIEDLTMNTNILSLNAHIEAARGKTSSNGFSVIAAQMKKLSNDSKAFSMEAAEKLKGIQDPIQLAMEIIDKTSKSMERSVNGAQRITEEMEEISSICGEQSSHIIEAGKNIDDSKAVNGNTAAAAEQLAATAEELAGQAEILTEAVGKFKVTK